MGKEATRCEGGGTKETSKRTGGKEAQNGAKVEKEFTKINT